MSRKATKFLIFYESDLKLYFKALIGLKIQKIYKTLKRNKTFNRWNLIKKIMIHQGRYYSVHKLNMYLYNFKVGELSKTRKPFFFRGKKK